MLGAGARSSGHRVRALFSSAALACCAGACAAAGGSSEDAPGGHGGGLSTGGSRAGVGGSASVGGAGGSTGGAVGVYTGGASTGGGSTGGGSTAGGSTGGGSTGGSSTGGGSTGGVGGVGGGSGESGGASGSGGTEAGGAGGSSGGGSGGSSGVGGAGGSTGGCEADLEPTDVEKCPGSPLTFTGAPLAVTVNGATNGRADDYSDCSGGGKESVYRFVAPQDGSVRATMTPSGIRATVYARANTCASGALLICENPGTIGTPATATFQVTRCGKYYVFADQDVGALNGTFTLELRYE